MNERGSASFWQRLFSEGIRRNQRLTGPSLPGAKATTRSTPDEQMAGLSTSRANEVRRRLTAGFGALGYDVSFEPSTVVLRRDGEEKAMVLDLDPLIDGLREDSSPQAVSTWTESFVTAAAAIADSSQLSTAEIYRSIRTVIMPALGEDGRPPFADHEYVVDPADVEDARIIRESSFASLGNDLLVCFALDVGEAVVPVRAVSLAETDDVETLRRAGQANLLRELESAEVDVDFHSVAGEDFAAGAWAMTSPSFYLTSAPLVLDTFLAQHLPQVKASEGVLFAVPTPSMLLVREVTEGEDLAHGLHVMAAGAAALAIGLAAGEPMNDAMVSPRVHVWRDGHVVTVSDIDEEGNYLVTPDDYLLERLQAGDTDFDF